jgi:DNA-binding HxlR family transcriptional regulator
LDIFSLLALKGTRKILVKLHSLGETRYSELVKAVGHSTTTTRALNRLENLKLVKRRVLTEKYRPVVYSLTEKGERLAEIVVKLEDFEKEFI